MSSEPVEILLVEDNPNDVQLTLHVFRRHNLANRVKVVRDGVEALDYLSEVSEHDCGQNECSIKVVLLDLKLPRVNGLEVLRQIKSDERMRTIPVVVLTSSREERDIVESYALGVNSYIVKPVDFQQFSEAVRQMGLYWMLINQPPRL